MSVTLSRRIRRIGILPQLSIEEVMDDNMKKKLERATEKAEAEGAKPADLKALEDLKADIARQVAPKRKRKLDLTPEQIAAEKAKLRAEAKARRVALTPAVRKSNYRRSKSRQKKGGK